MQTGQSWWREARYGMFIHWGLYALLAGEWQGAKTDEVSEWIMKHLQIPVEQYRALAADFNPVNFDADTWVGLAREAGMKYLVFTAKHHDGFAMYHSRCSRYNVVDATPFGRDPARLLSESCRRHGIKFCFYYSQAQDWDDPDGYGYGKPAEEKDFRRYFEEKCKPQVRELLTEYGDIGLMWFDTPADMTREQSLELLSFVKRIQPDCLVSGRIGNGVGEYRSMSDNCIPALPYAGDWEAPATLNSSWGYKKDDHGWKQPTQILDLLLRINSRGGNYLLNIGPDARGVVPAESARILREVGAYVRANGDSIHGTRATPLYPYDFRWCTFTSKPHHLYVHVYDDRAHVYLPCMKSQAVRVTLAATGEELRFEQTPPRENRIRSLKIHMPPSAGMNCRAVDVELAEECVAFDTLDLL